MTDQYPPVRSAPAREFLAACDQLARLTVSAPHRIPDWILTEKEDPGGDEHEHAVRRYNDATKRIGAALFDIDLADVLYDDLWTLAQEAWRHVEAHTTGQLGSSLIRRRCEDHEHFGLHGLALRLACPSRPLEGCDLYGALLLIVLYHECGDEEVRCPEFGGSPGSVENLRRLMGISWLRTLAVHDALVITKLSEGEIGSILPFDDEER